MKNRIISLILLLSMLLSLSSCGEYTPPKNDTEDSTDGTQGGDPSQDAPQGEHTVKVIKDGAVYIPTAKDPEMTVIATDGVSYLTSGIGADGCARFDSLDGDYAVSLTGLPEGYTYNPNINTLSSDKKEAVIELLKLETYRGNGYGLYGNDCIRINTKKSNVVYRAEITRERNYSSNPNQENKGSIVFFEYTPRMAGSYIVESLMDINAGMFNPKVEIYNGTSAYKIYNRTEDSGGSEGVYTKNFRFQIDIDEAFLGNCFTFGIFVEGKDATYPAYVDFSITYIGEYHYDFIKSSIIIPEFIPNYRGGGYSAEEAENKFNLWYDSYKSYLDEDRARFGDSNYVNSANSNHIFDENNYKLNPSDGYYHVFDTEKYADTDGWGPILYADIARSCMFMDTPFTTVEYLGSSVLTLSEGTEDYKLFIEGYDSLTDLEIIEGLGGQGPYFCRSDCPCFLRNGGICPISATGSIDCMGANEEARKKCIENCRHAPIEVKYQKGYKDIAINGRCPVTEELKEFLQKYSMSQRLFRDGDGWVETYTPSYHADEESQWLFACGYYTN